MKSSRTPTLLLAPPASHTSLRLRRSHRTLPGPRARDPPPPPRTATNPRAPRVYKPRPRVLPPSKSASRPKPTYQTLARIRTKKKSPQPEPAAAPHTPRRRGDGRVRRALRGQRRARRRGRRGRRLRPAGVRRRSFPRCGGLAARRGQQPHGVLRPRRWPLLPDPGSCARGPDLVRYAASAYELVENCLVAGGCVWLDWLGWGVMLPESRVARLLLLPI